MMTVLTVLWLAAALAAIHAIAWRAGWIAAKRHYIRAVVASWDVANGQAADFYGALAKLQPADMPKPWWRLWPPKPPNMMTDVEVQVELSAASCATGNDPRES